MSEAGLFNTDLRSAADYELMLRILLKYGVPAHYIPRVIVKMRAGGRQQCFAAEPAPGQPGRPAGMEVERIEALFLYFVSQTPEKNHSIYHYIKSAYG